MKPRHHLLVGRNEVEAGPRSCRKLIEAGCRQMQLRRVKPSIGEYARYVGPCFLVWNALDKEERIALMIEVGAPSREARWARIVAGQQADQV